MNEPCPTTIVSSGADLQMQSSFFRLHTELRLSVYEALRGIGLHVTRNAEGRYTFPSCVADHEAPDCRQIPPPDSRYPVLTFEDPVWIRRLASPWGNHWKCEEESSRGEAPSIPFLALLLTCKRVYGYSFSSSNCLSEASCLQTAKAISSFDQSSKKS